MSAATQRDWDKETARRIARRLGLPEEDVMEPDALADLVYRVELRHRTAFPRAPLRPLHVDQPPELGEEPLERYPLEKDRPPETGNVSWETDVALGLDEDLHKGAESTRKKRQRRS